MSRSDRDQIETYDDRGRAAPPGSGVPGKRSLTQGLAPRPVFRAAAAPDATAGVRDENGVTAGAEEAVAQAAGGGGAPLREDLRERFSASLGADLAAVRIHTGAASSDAASAVGARAYAVGNDIHFGAGQYQPDDPFGLHLIAHEVAHTQQQAGGSPHRQNKLHVSAPADAAEHEADRAADAMVGGQPFQLGGSARGVARDAKPADTSGDGQKDVGKADAAASLLAVLTDTALEYQNIFDGQMAALDDLANDYKEKDTPSIAEQVLLTAINMALGQVTSAVGSQIVGALAVEAEKYATKDRVAQMSKVAEAVGGKVKEAIGTRVTEAVSNTSPSSTPFRRFYEIQRNALAKVKADAQHSVLDARSMFTGPQAVQEAMTYRASVRSRSDVARPTQYTSSLAKWYELAGSGSYLDVGDGIRLELDGKTPGDASSVPRITAATAPGLNQAMRARLTSDPMIRQQPIAVSGMRLRLKVSTARLNEIYGACTFEIIGRPGRGAEEFPATGNGALWLWVKVNGALPTSQDLATDIEMCARAQADTMLYNIGQMTWGEVPTIGD